MSGLLEGKVVVISGVGPALGSTLARRCAGAGADLVLAARTVDRLEGLATEITATGRRALAVGTDITDAVKADLAERYPDVAVEVELQRADQQCFSGAVDETPGGHHL